MASKGNWTVVFEDRAIQKGSGNQYKINDDTFWNQSKFSNIWAIQYGASNPSDEVEYRDETPHSSYTDANLGDFQEFINRWDSAHLIKLQSDWDKNNRYNADATIDTTETEAEKIARVGPRPTSYSS